MLPLVTIEGGVVADPELRFTPSGMAVCSFRVAASSRKKNENDEWVDDKRLFLPCACFKQLAENVAESVVKGDRVVVTGRIFTDEWETEQGEKRSMVKMNADTVSVSLLFRTVKHGEGRAERREGGQQGQSEDPWAAPQTADEPPF